MRIARIHIENFRCIDELTWEPRQQNALVGQNNSGKSTILAALELALSPSIRLYPDSFSEYDFHNRDRTKPIIIDVAFGELAEDGGETARFADHLEPGASADAVRLEAEAPCVLDEEDLFLRVRFECTYDEASCEYHFRTYYRKWEDQDDRDNHVTTRDKEAFGLQMLRADRQVERAYGFAPYSVLSRLLRQQDVNLAAQSADMVAQARNIAHLLLQNTEFAALMERLAKDTDAVVPLASTDSFHDRLAFEVSDLSERGILHTLELFVCTALCEERSPVSKQGSGIRNAMVLSGLLLLARRAKQKHDAPTLIVAVEEPELSLHPHAQRYLLGALQDAATQLIVSTHSPTVAQSFKLEALALVRRDRGAVQIKRMPSLGGKATAFHKQIARHAPGVLADAYFSEAVLLVEGPTDRAALSEFSRVCAAEHPAAGLDRMVLSIIDVGGISGNVNLADALREGLGIPVGALVDRKGEDETQIDAIKAACHTTIAMPAPDSRFDPPDCFSDLEGLVCYQTTIAQLVECVKSMHVIDAPEGKTLHEWAVGRIWGRNPDLGQALQCRLGTDQSLGDLAPHLQHLEDDPGFGKTVVRKAMKEAFFATDKSALRASAWAGAFQPETVPPALRRILEHLQKWHASRFCTSAWLPEAKHVQLQLDG